MTSITSRVAHSFHSAVNEGRCVWECSDSRQAGICTHDHTFSLPSSVYVSPAHLVKLPPTILLPHLLFLRTNFLTHIQWLCVCGYQAGSSSVCVWEDTHLTQCWGYYCWGNHSREKLNEAGINITPLPGVFLSLFLSRVWYFLFLHITTHTDSPFWRRRLVGFTCSHKKKRFNT